MNTATIEGWASDGTIVQSVTTQWTHDEADPWAVAVEFTEHGMTWLFSLEVLRRAVNSYMTSHGDGDARFSRVGSVLFVDLHNGEKAARISVMAPDVQDFLADVNDEGADEIVSAALDEWLETLA